MNQTCTADCVCETQNMCKCVFFTVSMCLIRQHLFMSKYKMTGLFSSCIRISLLLVIRGLASFNMFLVVSGCITCA